MTSEFLPRRFLSLEGKLSDLPCFVCLGIHQEDRAVLTLEDYERAAHMYVCGVTGCGKSRFLESLMIQDIALGHGQCVLDPTGHLYRKALEFIAHASEDAVRRHDLLPAQIDGLLENFLFLDLDDPENPLRLNPLDPASGETTEEQVDDLLKISERLFGSMDEMRRIRQTLRGVFWVIAELNRLPMDQQPPIPEGFNYPLNLRFAAKFLVMSTEQREEIVRTVPLTPGNEYIRDFWLGFFGRYTPSQAQERIESSWNVLQYFLGDSLVGRLIDTTKSGFQIPDLLRKGTSLFCHLPLGKNLKGSQLICTLLATKFQRAAYRRNRHERQPYYLLIDEFHEFADLEFAKAAATLRQYHLRLVVAHQSQSQPPFHTTEGRSLLDTIKANAQVKVLFRLDREDAERMSKETFALSQRKLNFQVVERCISTSEGRSHTRTTSFQLSLSRGQTWSRAHMHGLAKTNSIALGRSFGTNIGRTLTKSIGTSIGKGLTNAISRSETRGITEAHSRQSGISVAFGKSWSHIVNHNSGFSLTERAGQSLALSRSRAFGTTQGIQNGRTESRGHDYVVGNSRGDTLSVSNGESVAFLANGFQQTETASGSLGKMNQISHQQGERANTALQTIRSITKALTQGEGKTITANQDRGTGKNVSIGRQDGTGGSKTHSHSQEQGVTQGRSRQLGTTVAQTQSKTLTQSQQIALAESFSILEQVTRTISESLQETVSQTDSLGGSETETHGVSEALAEVQSQNSGESINEKKVFFTFERERELVINRLQSLPQRHAIVTKEALGAVEIRTITVPDFYYFYRETCFPEEILRRQYQKFGKKESALPSAVKPMEIPEDPLLPKVAWFPDW